MFIYMFTFIIPFRINFYFHQIHVLPTLILYSHFNLEEFLETHLFNVRLCLLVNQIFKLPHKYVLTSICAWKDVIPIIVVYLIQKMTDNMFTQLVKYNMLAQIHAFVSSFCVIIFIF